MSKIAEVVAALKAVIAEMDHNGSPLLEELLAALKALVAEIVHAQSLAKAARSPRDRPTAALLMNGSPRSKPRSGSATTAARLLMTTNRRNASRAFSLISRSRRDTA